MTKPNLSQPEENANTGDEVSPGIDLRSINPLIDMRGDTFPVQAVLGFLSHMVTNATSDEGELTLFAEGTLAFSLLLDTCAAALSNMQGMSARTEEVTA